MRKVFKSFSPARIIVLAFFSVIFFGAVLLMLPFSLNAGMSLSFVDALFTSASAVCVTGLTVVDTYTVFSMFGRAVIAALIQVGGFGIASIGVGFVMLSGKHITLRERQLVGESWNISTHSGLLKVLKFVVRVTVCVELAGTVAGYAVFRRYFHPARALQTAAFNAISSFNNAGFDMLGNGNSFIDYSDDAALELLTAALIIIGGIGFLVIGDCKRNFKNPHKLSLHSKVVLSFTLFLLLAGTAVYRITTDESILNCFFGSVTARTAGFATFDYGKLENTAMVLTMLLMFVGASPGSTGGGIKTTTAFLLLCNIRGAILNRDTQAFRRKLPDGLVRKAFLLASVAAMVIIAAVFMLCALEPEKEIPDLLFETVSAFGTVGLSTGITSQLCSASKVLVTLVMYIGRLGPLTMVTVWASRKPRNISYSEEDITIG